LELDWVFDALELSAEPFALCALGPRDTLALPRERKATLHYVLAGRGEVVIANRPPVIVEAGAVVLVPALLKHALHGRQGGAARLSVCQPAALGLARHAVGDVQGDCLEVLCGRISLGLRGAGSVIDLLREPVVAPAQADGIRARALSLLVGELAAPRLGSRAVVRALLLECVIALLRDRLDAGTSELAWMAALADRRLWPALRAMLDAPGSPHSVELLAGLSGMSRSRFARRFARAYGKGPMQLLRDLRMRHAADLLLQTDLGVDRVAERAGFASRSYFTRQFEVSFGKPPGRFRRDAGGQER
jgi:AraC-like DNA-binding protein